MIVAKIRQDRHENRLCAIVHVYAGLGTSGPLLLVRTVHRLVHAEYVNQSCIFTLTVSSYVRSDVSKRAARSACRVAPPCSACTRTPHPPTHSRAHATVLYLARWLPVYRRLYACVI